MLLAVTVFLLSTPLWLAKHRLEWVPLPQPTTAPVTEFSELRAMQHVHHLVNGIGDRQVRDCVASHSSLLSLISLCVAGVTDMYTVGHIHTVSPSFTQHSCAHF